MNEKREVAAERRVVKGKKVRRLRRQGLVPAVLYGHHLGSISLQVDRDVMSEILRRGETSSLLQLRIGREKPMQVLIKQFQMHPARHELLHVDFFGVSPREKVRVQVPLRFVGEAPVDETHDVAIVRQMEQVEVECYPADLPRAIEVDLSLLRDLHSTIRVQDLAAGPGVAIVDDGDEVVVSVTPTAKEVVETLEAQAKEAAEEMAETAGGAVEEIERAA
ncbi:MAG: 50S ribosomal protein L25 [Sphingomonadaceae bacterium]